MTKRLVLHDSDYNEVISGLECVLSDRCGCQVERQEVQDVIDRVQSQVKIPDPLDFDQLRLANQTRAVEWRQGRDADTVPLTFATTELAGEVGELCNIIKKVERHELGLRGGVSPHDAWENICEEVGDVVICIDLIAMKLDIDLSGAIRHKFNKTSDKYRMTTKL